MDTDIQISLNLTTFQLDVPPWIAQDPTNQTEDYLQHLLFLLNYIQTRYISVKLSRLNALYW